MPTATNDGVSIHYVDEGEGRGGGGDRGTDRGDAVLFLGDLGYGAWQWGWQHGAVAGPVRTLVPDLRGAGRSDAPPGPYSVSDLAADAAAVLADAGVRTATVVGAGLGGMVALDLARNTGRVDRLVLLGTAAHGAALDLDRLRADPDDPGSWERSLAAATSARFREAQPAVVEQITEWRRGEDATGDTWAAQAAAVRDFDARDWLHEVTVPALVVHGAADAVWPPERARALADDLPRGSFRRIDDVGHLVWVEASRVVNDELLAVLDDRDDA